LTFRMAVAKVEAWKKETGKDAQWADYRNMRATHLARIPAFSTDVLQVGGNRHVVNANAPGGHGASWRMIVELDPKGTKAWGVYPGGQSGNVGSPYFLNMVAAWEKGQYFPLNLWLSSEKEVFIKQTFKAP
ncbi:MAG: penicillin acylase family protein, partial [Flammeovirgaceae bacterium]|nr:penicillin acylase family protein [Flammeovirgaceae bacterium]MDW8288355.1 penicillin acylase family protein [Flammeovirgaceae bacterium]